MYKQCKFLRLDLDNSHKSCRGVWIFAKARELYQVYEVCDFLVNDFWFVICEYVNTWSRRRDDVMFAKITNGLTISLPVQLNKQAWQRLPSSEKQMFQNKTKVWCPIVSYSDRNHVHCSLISKEKKLVKVDEWTTLFQLIDDPRALE